MWQFDTTNFIDKIQNFFAVAGQGSPVDTMVYLFLNGGWIAFIIGAIVGLFYGYMNYIQNKYAMSIKWTLLAIDIPQENLQSNRAVEHIFAAMWPFYESRNLIEKYIGGSFQQAFSLEIVSIGGYTQFLIRVPESHKDVVEAAIYAQYPKAEISEVEDYAQRYKDLRFPSDEYDLWGAEIGLKKPSPYPIRTHPSFEDSLTQTFADPMASVLEVFNKIDKGEELWMQMVITPINDNWKEAGYKIINKIIGAEEGGKKGILDIILYPFHYMITLAQELFVYGIGYEPGQIGESAKKADFQGPPNKMLYLTPEERNVIDGITTKISKLGYQTKFRIVYLGHKGKLNKPKGASAFIGAIQQFSTLDLNGFAPITKTMTRANYFFVKKRVIIKQNKILRYFRNRSQTYGAGNGFVLNIEELASIFHFPVPEAMRESVKSVETKKEVAPIDLPDTIYEEEQVVKTIENEERKKDESVKAEPPGNLPV